MDVPPLNGLHDESVAIASRLWAAIVAPATTINVSLVYSEVIVWKLAPLPELVGSPGYTGLHGGAAAPRDRCAVTVFHTGHPDDFAARRYFHFGMPATWRDGDLISSAGWDNVMAWAQAVAMATAAAFVGGTMQQLLMYPGVVDQTPENLLGVAFRRVSSLRVCHYLDKAPDLSLGLWP